MIYGNKFALQALKKVIATRYDDEISKEVLSGEERRDFERSSAAQYFVQNFSREKRYLIILSRDLQNEFDMIQNLGIEKARQFQKFWDFILDFEKLQALMKEFRWSADYLKENGIDFKSYRKLYFAVA